jgi:hypothetical protein
MLVQIKRSRLFAGLFSEVVARSRTKACLDQGLKTLCWVCFQKLLLGQEPMLVQIKGSRFFARFFLEVVARSRTNAFPYQGFKTLC